MSIAVLEREAVAVDLPALGGPLWLVNPEAWERLVGVCERMLRAPMSDTVLGRILDDLDTLPNLCGTHNGPKWHKRRGEQPCINCQRAYARYFNP